MISRQKCRKLLVCLAIFNCLFIVYYFLSTDEVNLEFQANYDYECSNNKSSLISKHVCFKEPHIFFVETSGSPVLNVRQACAVESTAYHNPSMEIYVLMTTSDPIAYENSIIMKLNHLPNIHFIRIDIDVLVHGSPIFKWYRQGKWKKSKWKISHMSDALRFLLIWKYGGIYLDMDIVTLKSLQHLKNAAVTENWDRVASGILFFDKGHELIKRCMFDFAHNYDPYNFVLNGPGVFTSNIKKYCDINFIDKVSGAGCGINILPPEAAFPIPYDKWEDYFVESSSEKNISAVFNSSYLIHVWNKYSHAQELTVGSNSLYELAIKQHCILSYQYAEKINYF